MSEDPAVRSKTMAAVRSNNTQPELQLRKALWAAKIRGYRMNVPLPGKPDIVFSRPHLAVFVDGCFWHRCPQCFRMPKTRREYWEPKIARNASRDREVDELLRRQHWTVLRFWEHEIEKQLPQCVERVKEHLAALRERKEV